jgi:hypothetical protein
VLYPLLTMQYVLMHSKAGHMLHHHTTEPLIPELKRPFIV